MGLEFKSIAYNGLVLLALAIVGVTLWYTNNLANELKKEEKNKVEIWAKAAEALDDNLDGEDCDFTFPFDVVQRNTTIPVILVDNSDSIIIDSRNLPKGLTALEQLKLIKKKYPDQRIEIDLIDDRKNYIYYKDSRLLQRLKYSPFFILLIIAAFMLIAYTAFSNARIAQQNKVWTGMAKETAHQIGTPLSSLMGWLEYLKEKEIDPVVLKEIQKDLDRLTTIASRFSKIGSLPVLEKLNIVPVLELSINYMRKRISSNTSLVFDSKQKKIMVLINQELFEWVIENILKNSIDAINKKGTIVVQLSDEQDCVKIDVIDNGKGVKKSFFKQIFQPGFTSKKRGWGLGLSLVKRIIKDYHKGEVSVIKSIPNKETVIRVLLNKE